MVGDFGSSWQTLYLFHFLKGILEGSSAQLLAVIPTQEPILTQFFQQIKMRIF